LRQFDLHSAGENAELLKAEHGEHLVMNGRAVYLAAVKNMVSSAAAVAAAGH